jgi:hypothetical protein
VTEEEFEKALVKRGLLVLRTQPAFRALYEEASRVGFEETLDRAVRELLGKRATRQGEVVNAQERRMKNYVENTTKAVEESPTLGLATAMPGGIEASERAGQAGLLLSDLLPVDIGGGPDEQKRYEALGFVFGEVVERDPIFREVKLPAGWSRKGSSHAMWSHIVDEKGRERVAVFYKAAFYDRRAGASLVRRHCVGLVEGTIYPDAHWRVIDGASGDVVFDPGPGSDKGDTCRAWIRALPEAEREWP